MPLMGAPASSLLALVLVVYGTTYATCMTVLPIDVTVTPNGIFKVTSGAFAVCRASPALQGAAISGTISVPVQFSPDITEPRTLPAVIEQVYAHCSTTSTDVSGCPCKSTSGRTPTSSPACALTGNGPNACQPIYKRTTTTIQSSTFNDRSVTATIGGVALPPTPAAGSGTIVVEVPDFGVAANGPDVRVVPTLVITVSEVVTTQKKEDVDWCIGSTCANAGQFTPCGATKSTTLPPQSSPVSTTLENSAEGSLFSVTRDLQAPTAVLEIQQGRDKYDLKSEVKLDLTVSEGTSTALEVSLNGPVGAVETVPFTPKFNPNGIYSFGLDIPCRAPPGPGYTITASIDVGADICGQDWDKVAVTAKDKKGVAEFEVVFNGPLAKVQVATYGLSVMGGDTPVLRSASCFSAVRNENLGRTNTYPGAWHFGQVLTFAPGNSKCDVGELVFSGHKTTLLALPKPFVWETTGQHYVHLWAAEPVTGVVLDYEDPSGQLGAELINGVNFTELYNQTDNTITVDWSNVGQDPDGDGNFAFTDLLKVYMRAKFRWSREVPPLADNTTYTLTSGALVTELNGANYPMDKTDTYTFDYLTAGCVPFPPLVL